MTAVVLDPGHPSPFTMEELLDLQESIEALGLDIQVYQRFRRSIREGVVLPEDVLTIQLLEDVAAPVVAAMLTTAIGWLRKRFSKSRRHHKYVHLLGPDGRILRSVRLQNAGADPEEVQDTS